MCFQDYFKDCAFDLCALDGASSILCEAIEAYVNECQDRGVNIAPWRNQTFCCESTEQWRMEEWKDRWMRERMERVKTGGTEGGVKLDEGNAGMH